ncbi:Do family serine endopeptidase [Verrucomicrobiales bacterium BCK34]|nr:Do family serine endopeptidase [Verrucomicrobiales bacterium BCK34]
MMKIRSNPLPRFLSLGLICSIAAAGLQADDVKFSDLKGKLTIDKKPVQEAAEVAISYAPALEKVMPAVVMITSSKTMKRERNPQQEEMFKRMFPQVPDDFFDRHGGDGEGELQRGVGSGVIISSDGYILTNNHVVGGADDIEVTLSNSKVTFDAKLVGTDPRTDVALIKIEAKDLKSIVIGDSSKVRIGDVAMAVGSPLELDQTATLGIISAVGRNDVQVIQNGFENFIQTDAAINRGNSGGPLVDAAGRLIGINTAISSGMSGGNIGIGFAIPSNMAINIVEKLLDGGGTVKRGFLGVYLRELDKNMAKALGRADQSGVLVTEVGPDTPAEKAGMKGGDLIIDYNGATADDMAKLRLDISNTSPGTDVTFRVIRNGKERDVKVKLGDLDSAKLAGGGAASPDNGGAADSALVEGVKVKDLDDETRTALQVDEDLKGIVVESVKDNVPAAESGLRPGMVITQIDQQEVDSVKAAYDIVENFEGDVLLLQVYVAGRRDILAIPLN